MKEWVKRMVTWPLSVITRAPREAWTYSLMWLLFTLVGGLMPLWGSGLLLVLCSQDVYVRMFIAHGEFALYAASFLSPALFLITRDYKTAPFPARWPLAFCAVACCMVAALIFAGVTVVASQPAIAIINQKFLLWSSTILLFLATVLAFLVTLIDAAKTMPNPRELYDADGKKLEATFDQMEGGKK